MRPEPSAPPHLAARKAKPDAPPPLPRIGSQAITPWAVAAVVQSRAAAAGFGGREFGGHSLKRGTLTTGMDRGVHPAKLKRLGRHNSFDVLGEYLEFGGGERATRSAACCDAPPLIAVQAFTEALKAPTETAAADRHPALPPAVPAVQPPLISATSAYGGAEFIPRIVRRTS